MNDCITMGVRLVSCKKCDRVEVVWCKDCKWWNQPGCAVYIVDDSDKPKENDFCSFGERRVADG
jgi:hypothetical protein